MAIGFFIGAGVMALGGVAELFLGVRAENTQLEDVAKPLTAEEAETGKLAGEGEDRGQKEDENEHRRRYRFGPGRGESFYSPGMLGTSLRSRTVSPGVLDREVAAIVDAVERDGPLRRDQIARRVRAPRWGPGRFATALREALKENRIRRSSGSRYEAVQAGNK